MTTEPATVGFTPVDEALPRLEEAVSPRVGIVTHTVSTTHTSDEASLPNCACALASAQRTLGAPSVEYGSGAHPEPSRARAAALGEALERYSGVYLPPDTIVEATARELGARAVRPSRFALYDETQFALPHFPLVPFTEDTRTTFVGGVALDDGSPALLPAELVYLRRPPSRYRPIGHATSSGLACGPTEDEAILAAFLELVERDAVMIAWKCRLSLPRLDWSEDAALIEVDRRCFASTGLRVSVLDASALLDIPAAISVLHGPEGSGAALAVGAAAAATVGEAWLKAVAESFGVYRWLRQQVLDEPKRPPIEPDTIESFDDHMRFYADDERAALAAFLDGSPEERPTAAIAPLEGTTPRAQIEALVTRLDQHGSSAYAVDVTSPDVRELGLSVARVIAPELCALDVSHRARHLGGRRILTAAYDAGLAEAPLTIADLNPWPHPFP
jgi:ribosomal protein S12 methylthiotransferase accessory factor